jgi:hypothetical protein
MANGGGLPALRTYSRVFLLVLSVLTTAFAAGEARATDWVVNMNDTGYDPIPAGGTIVYDIKVANEDLATATAPQNTIILSIPAGSRFEGGTGTITDCTPSTAPGPASVTCTVPPLPGGSIATLNARVFAETQGSIDLGVRVPTLGIDREPRNNAVSESTTITQGADIRLSLSGPATAQAGSNVSLSPRSAAGSSLPST